MFKIQLSRAIMVAPEEEFERKAEELRIKLKREPTTKEVLKASNAVIPRPEILERRVDALLQLKMFEETQKVVSHNQESDSAPKPDFLFKGGLSSKLHDFIAKQMAHIRKDCLSDPEGVNLHFGDYCARGSSSCELLFSQLGLAFRPFRTIGMVRAEMIIWTLLSEWNRKARIKRRGETDYKVKNIEAMLLVNSLCEAANFKLPFDIRTPSLETGQRKEKFGFELGLPSYLTPNTTEDGDSNPNLIAEEDDNAVAESEQGDDVPLLAESAQAVKTFESVLKRTIERQTTSLERFIQVTNDAPYYPLSNEDTPVANEERRLFLKMVSEKGYSLQAKSFEAHGFGTFAREWAEEVNRRYDQFRRGEPVVVIYHKSVCQLRDWQNKIVEEEQAMAMATPQLEAANRNFQRTMRTTRQLVPPVPRQDIVRQTARVAGPMPFGNPLTLNPSIAMARVGQQLAHPRAPYCLNIPRQPATVVRQDAASRKRKERTEKNENKVSHRTICIKCGRKKGDHVSNEFGKKNCSWQDCAKCEKSLQYHYEENLPTGFYCLADNPKYQEYLK